MFYISEVSLERPSRYLSKLQEQTYDILSKLSMDWQRVETEEAITMEDCLLINERLDMNMVKTLFLCNRQRTVFYLFVTLGDKPFSSKEFSEALSISRVSFAPAEMLYEKMETKVGAASIFGLLRESASDIQLVFDQDVLDQPFYGCSDGTTTHYLKLYTTDIINKLVPFLNRDLLMIKL
ncbi:YbaK/EbsC family protein [Myroides odoratimimus]|uniref:YbaK/EbsC family protein n=1 Tax=Myroides odoratimimus TaxID=76832 RepID=UPI003D2EF182